MEFRASLKTAGWPVSAVLAVPYTLVMLASLFLVGRLTNGSWQALFLGIGWNTLAGFIIGFLVSCWPALPSPRYSLWPVRPSGQARAVRRACHLIGHGQSGCWLCALCCRLSHSSPYVW